MKRMFWVGVCCLLVLAGGCARVPVDPEGAPAADVIENGDEIGPAQLVMRPSAPPTAASGITAQQRTSPPPNGGMVPGPTPYDAPPLIDRFNIGDPVAITISGMPQPHTVEDVIDEDGMIKLPYIDKVKALGLTSSELEKAIQDLYVPNFYKYATVSVFVPSRGYYIRGEVRTPGRYPLVPGLTIVQAVATAGGYTEFANPKRVRVQRKGTTVDVDLNQIDKHPERDILLEAKDVILVPRSWY